MSSTKSTPAESPGRRRFTLQADNQLFTDRVEELRLAEQALAGYGDPAQAELIILIDGMPGVGKSALGRRIAHTFADRFYRALEVNLKGHMVGKQPERPEDALAKLFSLMAW